MKLWKKIALGLGALWLTVMLLVGLLWRSAVQPDQAVPDLQARAVPVHKSVSAPPVETGRYEIAGVVVDEAGSPVEGVVIEAGRQELLSDGQGRFSGELERAVELSVMEQAARPASISVEGERLDLRFVVSQSCGLRVAVLDPLGEPVADAEVDLWVETPLGDGHSHGYTDQAGEVDFEQSSCGVASLRVSAEGYPSRRRRGLDTLVESEVLVRLSKGAWLQGSVVDLQGQGIDGAHVRAGSSRTTSEPDGSYGLWVDPKTLTSVSASAEGYRDADEPLRLSRDAEQAELDLTLDKARMVSVYCAGLPDDSCQGVVPLMCTWPMLPLGPLCELGQDPVVCECLQGEAAIRGGGQSVAVAPTDEQVWLDFRSGGGVAGQVVRAGEPSPCTLTVTFIPLETKDMLNGLGIVRMAECDENGHFEVPGLQPGTWLVDVRAGESLSSQSRQLPWTRVEQSMVELGEIDFEGGGRIEGIVVDSLTGQGAPRVAVVAVEKHPENPQLPRTITGFSISEGAFVLLGVEDGDYELMVTTAPFRKVDVRVEGGRNIGEVVLESRTADLLEDKGFHLVTDDQGELVVDTVNEGGQAEESGMLPGDEVLGVVLFGIDVEERFPDYNLSETILGSYDGPGVSLKVDREGEEMVLDL